MFDIGERMHELRCRETAWLRARRDAVVRERRRLHVEELNEQDIELIARDKALKAFQRSGRPLFVEQTGLRLPRLNNFFVGSIHHLWEVAGADRLAQVEEVVAHVQPRPVAEPVADLHHRLEHDRKHGRLEAEEQGLDDAEGAEAGIEPAQDHQADIAGQHEQAACHDAAPHAVHQPADVDGQLLSLRPGQQVAVAQRV